MSEIPQMLKSALQFFKDHKFVDSMEMLKDIERRSPRSPVTYSFKSSVQCKAARNMLREEDRTAEGEATAYLVLRDSIIDAESALAMAPTYLRGLLALADATLLNKEYYRTLQVCNRALSDQTKLVDDVGSPIRMDFDKASEMIDLLKEIKKAAAECRQIGEKKEEDGEITSNEDSRLEKKELSTSGSTSEDAKKGTALYRLRKKSESREKFGNKD